MDDEKTRDRPAARFLATLALFAMTAVSIPIVGQAPTIGESSPIGKRSPAPKGKIACSVDLRIKGMMKDILANALVLGMKRREDEVAAFLKTEVLKAKTAQGLLKRTAEQFAIPAARLTAEVETFRHCNCFHAGGGRSGDRPEARARVARPVEVSKFAKDVTLHVVLHELAHALIREFDLPVLGNEETVADAFATHYLTTYLPGRAFDAIRARTQSLMIEAREVPRQEWTVRGEHNSDARRAFQIAALAVAADSDKYRSIAKEVGMTERDIAKGRDYGSEIHRSWRRTLAPLWMPASLRSTETRLKLDSNSEFIEKLGADGLAKVLLAALQRFDWHSQVTIHLVDGDGGAGWNRSKRTITVNREYVERFVRQGKRIKQGEQESPQQK